MNTVTLNTKGLQSFKRQLNMAEKSVVEVGIFEDHAARSEGPHDVSGLNNVEIGEKHEFGSILEGIPERSFLRVPLTTELPSIIKGESDQLEKSFVESGAKSVLEQIGFMGEAAVQEAFDTAGFGTWPPNSPMTIEMKGSNKPLIDTSQLRKSISSRVR